MTATAIRWGTAALTESAVAGLAAAHLTPDERRHAGRYLRTEDRARFVAARSLLRAELAARTGAACPDVPLRRARRGKLQPPWPWQCSVAHSGEHVVVAITRRRWIGIDVERVERPRDLARLARAACSPAEWRALERLEPEARAELFTSLWTAKEAFVKATGIGLGLALREVELELHGGRPVALRSICGQRRLAARWRMRLLEAPAGYAAALVEPSTREEREWTGCA